MSICRWFVGLAVAIALSVRQLVCIDSRRAGSVHAVSLPSRWSLRKKRSRYKNAGRPGPSSATQQPSRSKGTETTAPTRIAAGAVVPPDLVVPDRMVVMGVPGKIVRPVKEEELQYMRWLRGHYVELAEKYVRGEFDVTSTTSI